MRLKFSRGSKHRAARPLKRIFCTPYAYRCAPDCGCTPLENGGVNKAADGPPPEDCAKLLRYIPGESAPIVRVTMEQAG
jgi:hypothetical protein